MGLFIYNGGTATHVIRPAKYVESLCVGEAVKRSRAGAAPDE